MPTPHRSQAISLDEAIRFSAQHAFSAAADARGIGAVGLEQEFIPVVLDAARNPIARVPLTGAGGSVARLDELAARNGMLRADHAGPMGPFRFAVDNGGQITFEPGGQIEHSTSVHRSVRDALDDLQRVHDRMSRTMADAGWALAAAGADLWQPLEALPLQLANGRYLAMAEYFDRRGPWGRVMMRHSASLQINLDLGPEGVWQERWRLANLLAPLTLATFAASPGEGCVSQRGVAWQGLDPSRTGFPRVLIEEPGSDPGWQWADAALAADVLLFRPRPGQWRPGIPGFSFGEWIRDGHPEIGWPTRDDLAYHLTTLFFEVRPKGFLELRSADGLPSRWRPAPVVLVSALLYDEQARQQALGALDGTRSRLPELWRRAASAGIRDPEIELLAGAVWEIALAGAHRLPGEYLGAGHLATAERYLELYTSRRRMPADDLRELAAKPARSLAWAVDSDHELPGELNAVAPQRRGDAATAAASCCCA